jgi:hypothetical protein
VKQKQAHIIYKCFIIVLIISLFAPSFVKFAHVFENHKHEVCIVPQESHFHEFDLDCEFYKFKNANQYHLNDFKEFEFFIADYKPALNSFYKYLISHRQLSFSLRGPPDVFV